MRSRWCEPLPPPPHEVRHLSETSPGLAGGTPTSMTGGEAPSAVARAPATRGQRFGSWRHRVQTRRCVERAEGRRQRFGGGTGGWSSVVSVAHRADARELREVFGSIPEPTCNQTVHIAFLAVPTAMALTGDVAPPGARAWTLDSKGRDGMHVLCLLTWIVKKILGVHLHTAHPCPLMGPPLLVLLSCNK